MINALVGDKLRGGTISSDLHGVGFSDSWDLQEEVGKQAVGSSLGLRREGG